MIIIIVKTKLLFDSILTILITKSLSNIFKRWSGCAGWGGGWDTLLSSCYGCFSERNLMKLNFHLSDRILSKIEHFAARNKLSPAITLHGLTRTHSQHLHITQDWEQDIDEIFDVKLIQLSEWESGSRSLWSQYLWSQHFINFQYNIIHQVETECKGTNWKKNAPAFIESNKKLQRIK